MHKCLCLLPKLQNGRSALVSILFEPTGTAQLEAYDTDPSWKSIIYAINASLSFTNLKQWGKRLFDILQKKRKYTTSFPATIFSFFKLFFKIEIVLFVLCFCIFPLPQIWIDLSCYWICMFSSFDVWCCGCY